MNTAANPAAAAAQLARIDDVARGELLDSGSLAALSLTPETVRAYGDLLECHGALAGEDRQPPLRAAHARPRARRRAGPLAKC